MQAQIHSTKTSCCPSRIFCGEAVLWLAAVLLAVPTVRSQAPVTGQNAVVKSGPIAIVPLAASNPDAAAMVTGALEVSQDRAVIGVSGAITAGNSTTQVTLPNRGVLRICATTTVKLATDSSVPAGEIPGLMMAMDHGAIEASFATGRNSDILLTPDFRILIGGPGAAEVRVRLGQQGDTCVENAGANAPYVLVSSVFDGGTYRVQSGQRVMFQHGSTHEVVDQEKESCGCPPAVTHGNEFPLAQSEGLAPLPTPAPSPKIAKGDSAQTSESLVYNSVDRLAQTAAVAAETPAESKIADPVEKPPAVKKNPGFFHRVGRFFKRVFGAD
jgi:hypothetical protein